MTVKELKAKLTNIPEDASVEMVICNTDNPFEEGCRVDKIAYFEWLQKDGAKTVLFYPALFTFCVFLTISLRPSS